MSGQDYSTKSMRGQGVFVLLFWVIAVTIAWYLANPEFAAWVNGYRDQALALIP
jgi:hypothetical protein